MIQLPVNPMNIFRICNFLYLVNRQSKPFNDHEVVNHGKLLSLKN